MSFLLHDHKLYTHINWLLPLPVPPSQRVVALLLGEDDDQYIWKSGSGPLGHPPSANSECVSKPVTILSYDQ